MNTTIGTGMTGLVTTFAAGTNEYYYTRFVSPPLFQTSLAANTWTYNFAAHQNQIAANFPVSASNQPVRVNCYVWRPGTGKIGTVLDGNTASTVDEGGSTATLAHHVTFTGSAVASMQNNDVIVFEAWFIITPDASGRSGTFYYDGTTVNTTDNATVTNHASFLETPEDLILEGAELFERDVTGDFTVDGGIVSRKKTGKPSAIVATLTIGAPVVVEKHIVHAISETPSILDDVTRVKYTSVAIGESVTIEDEGIGEKLFARGATETLSINSTVSRFFDVFRSVSETPQIEDAVTKVKRLFISITEPTVVISDAVTSAIRKVIRSLSESYTIDDAVTRATNTERSLSESFTVEDAVVRFKRAIVSIVASLTILDSVSRFMRVFRSIGAMMAFVESLTGAKIFFRDISESATIGDAVSRLYTAIRTSGENVTINSAVLGLTGPFLFLRDISETVEIEDAVARIRRVPRMIVEAIALVDSAISKLCRSYDV